MDIFRVCIKVFSDCFAFIALYGLLQCDLKKVKSTSLLGPIKSEKATDIG